MHPLFIRRCRVFPANSAQRAWIVERMRGLCEELGTGTALDGNDDGADGVLTITPPMARPHE
jgi:hypothetical protein